MKGLMKLTLAPVSTRNTFVFVISMEDIFFSLYVFSIYSQAGGIVVSRVDNRSSGLHIKVNLTIPQMMSLGHYNNLFIFIECSQNHNLLFPKDNVDNNQEYYGRSPYFEKDIFQSAFVFTKHFMLRNSETSICNENNVFILCWPYH